MQFVTSVRLHFLGAAALLAGALLGGCSDNDHHARVSTDAPRVTAQPADAAIRIGQAATFSAAASGAPAPSTQWQQSSDDGATYADIPGATGASYVATATSLADGGTRFRAVFSNASGSATSTAATLTVDAPLGLSLLAGSSGGAGNLDGPALLARFNGPNDTAIDAAGNTYVADTGNAVIRKISAGVVSTFAGTSGQTGFVDGQGALARFRSPFGLAIDGAGNLYVSDSSAIRKVDPTGLVTTLAGGSLSGSANGTGAAARFSTPRFIALDAAGDLLVADSGNNTIRKVTPAGVVTTLAGLAGVRGSADGLGSAARFDRPFGVAVGPTGTIYVTDTSNSTVRQITPAGLVSTWAGAAGSDGSVDGIGGAARFEFPQGIVVDPAGNAYVSDVGIRRIAADATTTTVVASTGYTGYSGLKLLASGNLLAAADGDMTLLQVTPAGVVTTVAGVSAGIGIADAAGAAAQFQRPYGVAPDRAGNLYVVDQAASTLRKVTRSGVVTTLAGTPGFASFQDGVGAAARFQFPTAAATDAAGNIYVADPNVSIVRKVTPGGTVTTLAGLAQTPDHVDGQGSSARFSRPDGVATDAAGNVYVADDDTIRKITPGGLVSTLAGDEYTGPSVSVDGTGSAARFALANALTVDTAGNVYVVDARAHTIRKVTPGGVVTTLAGTAGVAGSADGTGSAASFNFAVAFRFEGGIAVDADGNLYVADTGNHAIRKVTQAGVVTTIVGNPLQTGIVLGTDGRLFRPAGVAVLSTKTLLLTSGAGVLLYGLP